MMEVNRKLGFHPCHAAKSNWPRKSKSCARIYGSLTPKRNAHRGLHIILSKIALCTEVQFKKKKVAYKKAHGGMTAFEITKEVADYADWTESEAKNRHSQLKKEILKILSV